MTTMSKSFVFYDELDDYNPISCVVNITIIEGISNKKETYKIEYKYRYKKDNRISNLTNKIFKSHPFYGCDETIKSLSDGEIIIKNSMTTQMIKFLLMDDLELEKHSGNSTPQHYRNIIMINLVQLWD